MVRLPHVEGTAHRWASPGELVAYALPPGFHWLEILAAHVHSGASFMPVDVRLSDREQRRLLDLARPSVVVRPGGETILADAAPVDPDTAWAIVPTSGTGGVPRLAQLSRPAMGAAVAGSLDALDASAYDPWVACLSPAHIGGLLVLLRGAFTGSRVTILDRFEPGALLAEAPEGAHVSLVPTMLERLVRGGGDLTRLGTLLIGGAASGAARRSSGSSGRRPTRSAAGSSRPTAARNPAAASSMTAGSSRAHRCASPRTARTNRERSSSAARRSWTAIVPTRARRPSRSPPTDGCGPATSAGSAPRAASPGAGAPTMRL